MIKYHYHRALRDIPRIDVVKGDPLCHVYSDHSRDELVDWGRARGLKPEWLDEKTLPHYDAFGERLADCGPGVTRRELVADIRRWRASPDPGAVTSAGAEMSFGEATG